ncbi:MAG TPA: hypothetical protein VHB47_14790 [Thermoanaerobaculia bacterium]|jgi:hypothetical protein|nr:hypothetical protein [Thermoanaerobaculia bacterium]
MRFALSPPIAACLTAFVALSAPLPARPRPAGGVTILSGDEVDVKVNLKPLEPLAPAMRAILAYYAMRGTPGCPPGDWSDDGKVYEMKCPLTTALGLGRQCSDEQLALVNAWFKDGIPRLGLSRADAAKVGKDRDFDLACNDTPYTATHQDWWQDIRLRRDKKGLVTIVAKGAWTCGSACGGGVFTFVTTYRILPDRVQVVREREWHTR